MQQVAVGKFMVVEGQMMGSMKWQNQPLPCELSDVANAIFDGADAVMLGSPTSIGINPVEVSKVKPIIRQSGSESWACFDQSCQNGASQMYSELPIQF